MLALAFISCSPRQSTLVCPELWITPSSPARWHGNTHLQSEVRRWTDGSIHPARNQSRPMQTQTTRAQAKAGIHVVVLTGSHTERTIKQTSKQNQQQEMESSRRSDEGLPGRPGLPLTCTGVGEVSKQKHVRVGVATSDLSVNIIDTTTGMLWLEN